MIPLLLAVAAPAADARAGDAVAAFEQLCVAMFVGGKSGIDPARFSVAKLPPQAVKAIKPDLVGRSLWDVSGRRSAVRMLVHYERAGICVVEVAEAGERDIRAGYAAMVGRLGRSSGRPPVRLPDQAKRVGAANATTMMWRLAAGSRPILLALTSYPTPRFMVQHVLTVSHTR